jgi:hypothetical protein
MWGCRCDWLDFSRCKALEKGHASSQLTVSKKDVSSNRRVRNEENKILKKISRITDNGLLLVE